MCQAPRLRQGLSGLHRLRFLYGEHYWEFLGKPWEKLWQNPCGNGKKLWENDGIWRTWENTLVKYREPYGKHMGKTINQIGG